MKHGMLQPYIAGLFRNGNGRKPGKREKKKWGGDRRRQAEEVFDLHLHLYEPVFPKGKIGCDPILAIVKKGNHSLRGH